MSAIYQRARPIRWEDIVGQEHVKDVLRSALEQGRIGHAYLFSGPRGVGKTTTARLIAMTANCTSAGPKPCGECESCLAVRSGNHPDVLEIDAASNNSVDDVRDLREKVSLAAMRGGKKIYILDEAHMMTRSAFNALLKTLEEPPSHVIFILATTEPEKIIPTILSRCQHYRFRRLTPEEIAGKLSGLVSKEGIRADPDALNLIGRLADGAMRDGESLLERMLAAGSAITKPAVEEALGLPPGERVRGIAGALVLGDAGTAIAGAAGLYRDGFAARTVVEGLVAAFGAALHAELGLNAEGKLEGADVPRLLKLQAALDEQESRFARSADQQSLELALTHAILALGSNSSAGNSGAGNSVPVDLVQRLNRMEKELAALRGSGARPAPTGIADFDPVRRVGGGAGNAVTGTGRAGTAQTPRETAAEEPVAVAAAVRGNWADVLKQASMQLRAFLKPAKTHAEAGYVSLTYDDKSAFHAKQVAGKFDELGQLVLKVFGPVTLELVAPEGTGRKQKLGGKNDVAAPKVASAPVSSPAPAPTPEPPPTAVTERAAPAQPTPSMSSSPSGTFNPTSRPDEPFGTDDLDPSDYLPHTQQTGASLTAQEVNAPPPRRANVATLERPQPRPERKVAPYSPDDVAAAPLASELPGAWEKEHVADAPPAPADASGGDLVTPVGAPRELYIVEAITEEPDWGDIGGSFDALTETSAAPLLEGAPFAEYSAARPAQPPVVQSPTAQPLRPKPTAPTERAPQKPGDIRAHPLYEEVKSRFSGRVRELGKNRNYQPPATAEDAEPSEEEAPDTAEA